MKSVYIVDVMREVVGRVSAKLTPSLIALDSNITGVHYDHGHPLEIINTLADKDKSNTFTFRKYPLVALFQDFPESKGEIGFDSEVTLHMIIARSTVNTYKAQERYEKNFKPFLYPIYQELLNQIWLSKPFNVKSAGQIQHTKIDRLYWGKEGLYKNEGNVFNDFIDCIEIKDLKLKVNLKNC